MVYKLILGRGAQFWPKQSWNDSCNLLCRCEKIN